MYGCAATFLVLVFIMRAVNACVRTISDLNDHHSAIQALNAYFQRTNDRPASLVGMLALCHHKNGGTAAALALFKEMLRLPTKKDVLLPDPFATVDVRYAFAKTVYANAAGTLTATKQWTKVNEELERATLIMGGYIPDFAREILESQCNAVWQVKWIYACKS
jgi:ATP/maltotriose-dependent transcriptional regulator MalT